ncbi:MAG TPA: hypothetical protein VMV07_20300 [Streptosporangiaceae bacterium]|nr:hypothetical protein [Streptosporangiaceae bacterium]
MRGRGRRWRRASAAAHGQDHERHRQEDQRGCEDDERRRRDNRHDVSNAREFQDPHRIPTTGPWHTIRPARWTRARRVSSSRIHASGTGRAATRGGGEVIELECGITVYPAREEPGRWRAVWYEDGERQQCEASTEEKLAAKLEKVTERLRADAPNMKRPGAALVAHYLDPDRLPVNERWSRARDCRHGNPLRDRGSCRAAGC